MYADIYFAGWQNNQYIGGIRNDADENGCTPRSKWQDNLHTHWAAMLGKDCYRCLVKWDMIVLCLQISGTGPATSLLRCS